MLSRFKKAKGVGRGRTNGSSVKSFVQDVAPDVLETIAESTSSRRLSYRVALLLKILTWGGGILCTYLFYRWARERLRYRKKIAWENETEEGEPIYDACIVGAGPSGSSCAYYLAKAGKKVLVLEKQRFPHDKVCGDVITPLAQAHLQEMGVLDEIIQAKEGNWACTGGFVSPSGKSFLGKLTTGERLLACQRIILDEKIARAAETAGATVYDGSEVKSVEFDKKEKYWIIRLSTCDLEGNNYKFRARALVAADGAESGLARKLGVVTTPPSSYCSRSFAKAGTHSFPDADHVVFFSKALLPGYFTVFHELENFLNLCCYFIPCDEIAGKGKWSKASKEELQRVYENYLKNDPFIRQALGPKVVITPCKFAPIRVGGVKKSYADHFVVVGDAAGQVDPLTGAGIYYGLEAGKLAAETIAGGLNEGDLSARRLREYQDKWKRKFGFEFWLAGVLLHLLYRFPILLDAGAKVIKRKGDGFVGAWATAMMGGRSKMWFLYPTCAGPIFFEACLQWIKSWLLYITNSKEK